MLEVRLYFSYLENKRVDAVFRKKPEDDGGDPTITAETKMAMMLVQHYTFFNLSDRVTKFINTEVKESQIAPKQQLLLLQDTRFHPFCLMLDGSSDNDLEKIHPLTFKIFDINFSRAMTKFADINIITGRNASTVVSIFDVFNE